jgi:type II secretory pathway pseudopilin PulG
MIAVYVGNAARTIPAQTSPDHLVECAARTTPAKRHVHHNSMAGFSYVEVLVAIVLIAVALVPAMEALQPGIAGSGIQEIIAEDHYQLTGRLEQVLVEPFGQLNSAANAAGSPTTPSSYSDIFTYANGRQITRNVFLSRYDADNADTDNDPFTGTDDGLLWVRVAIAGTGMSIESLVSEYD